jgi:hypothetical protein
MANGRFIVRISLSHGRTAVELEGHSDRASRVENSRVLACIVLLIELLCSHHGFIHRVPI